MPQWRATIDGRSLAPVRIGIVGGGPGGLLTAWLLERSLGPRARCTILEAGHRLGGTLDTRTFDHAPVIYEAGTAEVYDHRRFGPDALHDLLVQLGLPTRATEGRAVVAGGRALRDPAASLGPAARRAVDDFRRRVARELPGDGWMADAPDERVLELADRPLAALLREVRSPIARRYLETSMHADLAADPHAPAGLAAVRALALQVPDLVPCRTLVGGMSRLAQRLERDLSATIELGARVAQVGRARGGGCEVRLAQAGQRRTERFDVVVLALPVGHLSSLTWGNARLARAMTAHVARYDRPGHYLRASLLIDRPTWRAALPGAWFMVDGFGGACVYNEHERHPGLHPHGVLGFLLAGNDALMVGNLPDDEVVARVLEALPAEIAGPARRGLLEARVHRWAGALSGQPGTRSPEERRRGHQPEPRDHPGVHVVGDYLYDCTLNGVLASARWTAGAIGRQILGEQRPLANIA